MESSEGTIPLLKEEPALLNPYESQLLDPLEYFKPQFDERGLEMIGKSCGFVSADDKVYKMIGCIAEQVTESILSSINHIKKKEIENISKKIKEAETNEKMPPKKFQMIKNTEVGSRVLTIKDVVSELNDRGLKVQKLTVVPQSELDRELVKEKNYDEEKEQ